MLLSFRVLFPPPQGRGLLSVGLAQAQETELSLLITYFKRNIIRA